MSLILYVGVTRLEQQVRNLSFETERLAKGTSEFISSLQTEVNSLVQTVLKNVMALELLRVSQGGCL